MSLKKLGFLVSLILFMAGCTATMTFEQIVQKANMVNTADGVSKDEAVLIAQKYLIDNKLDATHSIKKIEQVSYDPNRSLWTVHFGGVVERGASQFRRFGFTPSITIKVDGKTGRPEITQ